MPQRCRRAHQGDDGLRVPACMCPPQSGAQVVELGLVACQPIGIVHLQPVGRRRIEEAAQGGRMAGAQRVVVGIGPQLREGVGPGRFAE